MLTETSSGPGTRQLIDGLRQDGHRTYSTIDARDRGALIATRLAVSEVLTQRLGVTLPWRAPAVLLDLAPAVAVVGVYVPSRDRSEAKIARKRAFIASLLDGLRALPEPMRHHLLLVGDYNAVARRHDPPLRGLLPYEYALHDTLEDLGLQAAHELTPAAGHPHSWIGRTGIGYLYDYIHVGAGLHTRLQHCAYLHDPRTLGLSDHAAVIARLRLR